MFSFHVLDIVEALCEGPKVFGECGQVELCEFTAAELEVGQLRELLELWLISMVCLCLVGASLINLLMILPSRFGAFGAGL